MITMDSIVCLQTGRYVCCNFFWSSRTERQECWTSTARPHLPQQQEIQGAKMCSMVAWHRIRKRYKLKMSQSTNEDCRWGRHLFQVTTTKQHSTTSDQSERDGLRGFTHMKGWATRSAAALGLRVTSCTVTLQCLCPMARCRQRVRGCLHSLISTSRLPSLVPDHGAPPNSLTPIPLFPWTYKCTHYTQHSWTVH